MNNLAFLALAETAPAAADGKHANLVLCGLCMLVAFSYVLVQLRKLQGRLDGLDLLEREGRTLKSSERQPTGAIVSSAGEKSGREIGPEEYAMIAAAVHSSYGRRANIVSCNLVLEPRSWGMEGRRALLANRRTR